jgi:hypothetical protein
VCFHVVVLALIQNNPSSLWTHRAREMNPRLTFEESHELLVFRHGLWEQQQTPKHSF